MSNDIKICVIISNYNHFQYLNDSIKSITEQTYGNMDIVVVDDGSTNKSNVEEIISLYYLMGGDKDGISCERLNSCLATFYNIYENGDFTSEVNSSNNRDYQYEAQQIINLLGSKSNNRLSLQDFVNLMTSESV